MMNHPNFEQAKRYALSRLKKELSPLLYYHSYAHTSEDVLLAVRRFCSEEGIDPATRLLIQTAALFHDIGYLVQRHEHEQIGVDIAQSALPQYGYSVEDLALISEMIMATRLPQNPSTLPQQILADADMDSLGRNDFLTTSFNLRSELAAAGFSIDHATWIDQQKAFLQSHRYFTQAARKLRDDGKHDNIKLLTRLSNEFSHYRATPIPNKIESKSDTLR